MSSVICLYSAFFLKALTLCALTCAAHTLSAHSAELQKNSFSFCLFSPFKKQIVPLYQNSPTGMSAFMLVFVFIYLMAVKSDNHLVSSCPETVVHEASQKFFFFFYVSVVSGSSVLSTHLLKF